MSLVEESNDNPTDTISFKSNNSMFFILQKSFLFINSKSL